MLINFNRILFLCEYYFYFCDKTKGFQPEIRLLTPFKN